MESMFELSTTKHLRGHELKLTKHRSKLEVRRHFFTEREAELSQVRRAMLCDVDNIAVTHSNSSLKSQRRSNIHRSVGRALVSK